jgi:RNA polymerase sigma-70 factor (ECF subfamily)
VSGLANHDVNHDAQALSLHALGLLSAAEARALEAHLAGCADCCRLWQEIRATVDALGEVPPELFDTTRADPTDLVLQRTLRAVRAEKRAQTRHRLARPIAAAAVAVLVALAGAFTAGRATAPESPIVQAAGGQTVAGGGVGGADLRATITPSGQWVRLVATASGFPRGQRCRLVVVTADGRREIAGSWTVPPAGEPPGGVVFAGSAAVPLSQVRAVAVDTDSGQELAYLQI